MQLQSDMLESGGKNWMQAREQIFKGIVHSKSLFTHPYNVTNQVLFLSINQTSSEKKGYKKTLKY